MEKYLNDHIECPHLYLVGDSQCRLCLRDIRTGLLWWSNDRATVGLIVKEGVVIDAPPYARKWALGRKVDELPEPKESTFVTDQNFPPDDGPDDGIDWGDMQQPPSPVADTPQWQGDVPKAPARPAVSYPENGAIPEAPISINFRVTGEPQITVRGYTGADVTAVLQDLSDNGVWANIAAAQADLRGQGQLGAGLGPMTPVPPAQPAPAPQGPPFGPNVSVPSAPGYVGPPSYQSGPPAQTPSWGGAPGGGQANGNRAEPAAQPPGWMRVNARTGPGFDAWKAMREQFKDQLKGKVRWGGKSDYWIEPSIAQWISQQGFAVTP